MVKLILFVVVGGLTTGGAALQAAPAIAEDTGVSLILTIAVGGMCLGIGAWAMGVQRDIRELKADSKKHHDFRNRLAPMLSRIESHRAKRESSIEETPQ